MTAEQIRQYLEYYRDIGITHLNLSGIPIPVPQAPQAPEIPQIPQIDQASKVPTMDLVLPTLAPEGDSLARIREDIGDCKRCGLCHTRKSIVFGSGNERAKLIFVGEAPGADEDEQGLPFVGRAGQLLTQMIDGTAAKDSLPIRREDCYICNVVKCRPPENRTPLPDEMEICGQFLFRQLMSMQPKAICALGATAAKALLNSKESVTKMRGKWHRWNGIPLLVTYHPSYLLRAYNVEAKKEAWGDLRKLFHYVLDDTKVDPE